MTRKIKKRNIHVMASYIMSQNIQGLLWLPFRKQNLMATLNVEFSSNHHRIRPKYHQWPA